MRFILCLFGWHKWLYKAQWDVYTFKGVDLGMDLPRTFAICGVCGKVKYMGVPYTKVRGE